MNDMLLRLPEAARLLGVHIGTLRRWDNEGKLKAARTPGGQRRYRKSDICSVIEGRHEYTKYGNKEYEHKTMDN